MRKRPSRKRPIFLTFHNSVFLLLFFLLSFLFLSRSRFLVCCLFVLDPYPHLSRGVNSRGRTYGELPYHPGHSSPPGLFVLHVPYPPILIVMHPASGQSPPLSSCPIQISYQVSGLPPPCLPVLHI